jgi:hypothetical protein
MSSDEMFVAEVLRALERVGLEAIVVGMIAAALQGAPITTQDIDLLVRDTPRDREKLEDFARAMGAALPVRLSPLSSAVTLGGAAMPIDVLFDAIPPGIGFETLRSRARSVPIGQAVATVATLEDVIASKESAGRPKDLAVLPILRDTLRIRTALEETQR